MGNQVLILVGLPGSGKTTFSQKLIEARPDWRRVNQDDLGSRKNCEIHCRKYLKSGLNVVIDRCNFDPQQRSTWIKIAEEFGVPVNCIVFTADEQTCRDRILQRQDHPTGVHGEDGAHILRKFLRNYKPPLNDKPEGIQRLLHLDPSPEPLCTVERVDTALRMLEQSPIIPNPPPSPPQPQPIPGQTSQQ